MTRVTILKKHKPPKKTCTTHHWRNQAHDDGIPIRTKAKQKHISLPETLARFELGDPAVLLCKHRQKGPVVQIARKVLDDRKSSEKKKEHNPITTIDNYK